MEVIHQCMDCGSTQIRERKARRYRVWYENPQVGINSKIVWASNKPEAASILYNTIPQSKIGHIELV